MRGRAGVVVIGDALLEAKQGRPVLDRLEPLGELSSGHIRDPSDQNLMGLFGVLVRHTPSWLPTDVGLQGA